MVERSAIYHGVVRHTRAAPPKRTFSYRLFMMYLDLDELDELASEHRWLSVERWNVASFRRRDYFGDPDTPLAEAVRDRVEATTGSRPLGAVRALTHLRYWGYCFNPVTFYYCFDPNEQLQAVLSEITNTPWGDRHAYVSSEVSGDRITAQFDKRFYVSPYQPMEQRYAWAFSAPDDSLRVSMVNTRRAKDQPEEPVFTAHLDMERRDTSRLNRSLLTHPFMTAKVVAGIYWQAARLSLRRAKRFRRETQRPEFHPS